MRILCVDLGTKRIGLAVGESEFSLASPRPALSASGKLATDAESISQKGKAEEADLIVIGIPFNESDTRMERACRKLGELLEDKNWNVRYVDETLTSIEAESRIMGSTDLTAAQRRKVRDGEAACLILERFFNEESI